MIVNPKTIPQDGAVQRLKDLAIVHGRASASAYQQGFHDGVEFMLNHVLDKRVFLELFGESNKDLPPDNPAQPEPVSKK